MDVSDFYYTKLKKTNETQNKGIHVSNNVFYQNSQYTITLR